MGRGLPLLLTLLTAVAATAAGAARAGEIATAERLVFMEDHLHGLHPPAVLRYRLQAPGADAGDQLQLTLRAREDGGCCAVAAEERGGESFAFLPPVGEATANPVILYFLERDLREMQGQTGGQPNYFRRLIRLALAEEATVEDTTVRYGGREIAAKQVRVVPYAHDPRVARFGALAGKTYIFLIAPGAPGGVLQLKTTTKADRASSVEETALTLVDSPAVEADGRPAEDGDRK